MTATATEQTAVATAEVATPTRTSHLLREQAGVVVGQGLAGAGNMAFSLIAAHALAAPDFARLATFLALYLLLLVPSTGLAAAAAADPARGVRTTRVVGGSVLAGAAIAVASVPLGTLLGLGTTLVALLGLAFPGVTVLAVVRGRLYGSGRRGVAVGTLVAEPAVRLAAGAVLLGPFGATGAALAVVGGGYLALLVGLPGLRRGNGAVPGDGRSRSTAMVVTFLAMSLLQNIDVILANNLLGGSAGTFAAVSTLGGISVFATATIPLVLLPRMRPGSSDGGRALGVAVLAACALGGTVVLLAAVAPASAYAAVLGDRYAGVAHVAVPYLGAMALFGAARVVAAHLCSAGLARVVIPLAAAAIAVQVAWILLASRTPTGVATGTELAVIMLSTGLGVTEVAHRLTRRTPAEPTLDTAPASTPEPRRSERPDWWLLAGLVVLAATVRGIVTRGLWVDEATSVAQARMSYGGMLADLRDGDVHPPGYFTILWGWVRMFGDGPLAVRMPSIILGVALIPVLYFATREIFDRRTARIAAVLGVVAPQAVWYSQEARMYSLFMLLVVLGVWAQARIMRTGSRKAWAAYALVTVALVYTQYFTTLVVLAQQVVFLLLAVRRRRRGLPVRGQVLRWLAAMVAVAVLVAPLLPFAYHQFAINQAAGKGFGAPSNTGAGASTATTGPSTYSLLANVVWVLVGYHSDATMTDLGALWPMLMLLVLLMLGRGRSTRTRMVALVAVLPVLALYAAGQEKSFIFDLRYFIGAVPLAVMLFARAAARWPARRAGTGLAVAVLVGALTWGLYDQQVNGENPRRYDFSPALTQIAGAAGPHDDVVLSPAFLSTVSKYYEPQLHYDYALGAPGQVAARATSQRVFLLGSFFSTGGQRARVASLISALTEDGRHVVHVWRYDNVKVWVLS